MFRLISLLLSFLSWELRPLVPRRKRSTFIFEDEGREVFYFFHSVLMHSPFNSSPDGIYKGHVYVRENGRWCYRDDVYISVEDFQRKYDMTLVELLQNESYKSIRGHIAVETTAPWKRGGGLNKRSEYGAESDLETSLRFFEVCEKLENESSSRLQKSPKLGLRSSLKRWACIVLVFTLYFISLPFMYIVKDLKSGSLFLMFCATTFFQVPIHFFKYVFIPITLLLTCMCSFYMDLNGKKQILAVLEKVELTYLIEKLRSKGIGRCNPFTSLLSLSKMFTVFDDAIVDGRFKIKEECLIPLNSDTETRGTIIGESFSAEFKQIYRQEYQLTVKDHWGIVIYNPVVTDRCAKILTNFFDYLILNENNLVCDGSLKADAMGSRFTHALSIQDIISKLIRGRVLKQCFLENEIEIRGETVSISSWFKGLNP